MGNIVYGKEYHKNWKILYEGEWLNTEANGKGKKYNRNGDFIFEGEYKIIKGIMELKRNIMIIIY